MRILLVCNAGMSTSMLVNKMKQYADQNGIPLGVMDMKDYGRQNCKNIFAMIDELMGK